MVTNYYYKSEEICPACGHDKGETLHIGRSSAGWVFALHVYPEWGIRTLQDWIDRLDMTVGHIEDEYGYEVSYYKLMDIITNRDCTPPSWDELPNSPWYKDEEDFHKLNHSQRGPKGLLRFKIDGSHCVGHGEGTWDYIIGDFS